MYEEYLFHFVHLILTQEDLDVVVSHIYLLKFFAIPRKTTNYLNLC